MSTFNSDLEMMVLFPDGHLSGSVGDPKQLFPDPALSLISDPNLVPDVDPACFLKKHFIRTALSHLFKTKSLQSSEVKT
jgi:hypothetical protein